MEIFEDFEKKLDACKKHAPDGGEYWMARDIQPLLGYAAWEKFEALIERARVACESSGVDPVHQFHRTVNMVNIGSGAQRERADWYLARYGCYLIAMNGEPSKPEIALAQQYFAVFDMLWADIREQIFEPGKFSTACVDKLTTVAAKEKLTRRYREYIGV